MKVVIDATEYLPIVEAAQQLATTETKVLMLLKQKSLAGDLIDGEWFVTTASLACYDAHAENPEKQAQCRTSCSSSSGCSCH
jgi:hypothetical protein